MPPLSAVALLAALAAPLLAAPARHRGHRKPAAPAAPADPAAEKGRALAERVQRFYRDAKDFTAPFEQTYTYVALGSARQSSGVLQVKKPGLARWEYEKPEKKLMVLDGQDAWIWVPEDNQVTVTRRFSSDQLLAALRFVWGRGGLLEDFTPREGAKVASAPDGDALELTPKKPSASLAKLVLVVGKDGAVLASLATDAQGNVNQLVFRGLQTNQGLSDALFHFAPPAGANVQEVPGGQLR